MEYATPTTNVIFTGTIDQLLLHCASIDLNDLNSQIEYENTIEHLIDGKGCTRDEAVAIVEEAKMEMLQETLLEMMNDGSITVTYDENGQEIYQAVEKPKKKKKKN